MEPVSSKELAEILGVSTRRIQQLDRDEGILKNIGTERKKKYEVSDSVQSYVTYITNSLRGIDETSREVFGRKEEAEADLKEAKAEIVRLELSELKGHMHRSEDVEAMTTDLILNIKHMIFGLPGQIAVRVIDVKTEAEAAAVVKTSLIESFEVLSNYRYDPQKYQERVRERQGWDVDDD